MDINYLPPEVLTKIFSYLPQLDLLTSINTVCHYWNEVAFSSSLWKTIDIAYITDDTLDIYLQNIDHYQHFVQILLINRDYLMKFFDIRKNRNLSNLRKLQVMSIEPDRTITTSTYTVEFYPGIISILLRIFKSADIFSYLSFCQIFS